MTVAGFAVRQRVFAEIRVLFEGFAAVEAEIVAAPLEGDDSGVVEEGLQVATAAVGRSALVGLRVGWNDEIFIIILFSSDLMQ